MRYQEGHRDLQNTVTSVSLNVVDGASWHYGHPRNFSSYPPLDAQARAMDAPRHPAAADTHDIQGRISTHDRKVAKAAHE
jgi:hypothetical protein